MSLKKSLLILTFIPFVFSCSLNLPGLSGKTGTSGNSPLATKAEALKYFDCALNNPKLNESQKATIKTIVLSQINLIPDSAWEAAKTGFEGFAKNFACNDEKKIESSTKPEEKPTAESSAKPEEKPASTPSSFVLKSRDQYINLLQCANKYFTPEVQNQDSGNIALAFDLSNQLLAINLIDATGFELRKETFQTIADKYSQYCKEEVSDAPAKGPTAIKTAGGISEYSCTDERNLKSGASKTTVNLSFVNNSEKKLKLYWLSASGTRRAYNKSFLAGATHNQSTYTTHPWLVADENDQCVKILVPDDASANNAKIEL